MDNEITYYDKLLNYAYKTAHGLDCVVIGSFSVLNYAHTDQSHRGNIKVIYLLLTTLVGA